ncbi:MAG: AsmA protein [Halioglobus sp.]|jgi:AsmA protein
MSRTILILITTPLFLIIAAALLIPVFLDKEALLTMASETLEKETGAVLVVDGDASLSLFPEISVGLSEVSLTLPGETETSVRLASLGIGLKLMPLFSGRAEISELVVDGLKMTVVSAPEQPALDTTALNDEQLDALYIKRRKTLQGAGQAAGSEAVVALPLALNVARLSVSNSTLDLVSADKKETTQLEIVRLEATGLNLDGEPIPLSLNVIVSGGEGGAPLDITLIGKIQIQADKQLLTLNNLAVEVLGALDQPVNVKASGEVNLARQVTDLQLQLTLGGGDIAGQGQLRYAAFETPQIDAKLHFNKFDPALFVLAGPAAATSKESAAGASGDDALPLNAIRAIDTRATLSIDEVNLSGHVVSGVQLKLRAVDGIVKLFPFTGTLHEAQLTANTTFNAQYNPAKFFSKGELSGLSIAQALAAMESEPIMTGKTDLQWKLNSTGGTTNQLIEAMNGPIDLLTSEVVLKSMGIEKMLCEAVALANQKSTTNTLESITRFDNISVNLKMSQGKLLMKPLRAELPHVQLKGEGNIDILKQDFSVTFNGRLSPDLGELDPACKVNQRLTAIDWPVKCKGKLNGDPASWCAVDAGKIIQDLATKEVENQVEKQASKFLNKFLNK